MPKRVQFVVEGPSDKLLFDAIAPQLRRRGISPTIVPALDRARLIRDAPRHLRTAQRSLRTVSFVLDQDEDRCPPQTAERLDEVRSQAGVTVCVAAREIEAWILADPFVEQYLGRRNPRVGILTDAIRDPKKELANLFFQKYHYMPTSTEAIKAVAAHFDLARAQTRNASLARFLRSL